MAANEFDLTAALRALGVKGNEGKLDLVELLQPTLQVGDISAMGPAILPPTSAIGGQQSGLAGSFAVIQITGSTKAGCFIQFDGFSSSSNVVYWQVLDTPLALTGAIALDNVRIAHQASTASGQKGTSIPGFPIRNSKPQFLFGNSSPVIYVDPGRFLTITGSALGALLVASTVIQDVPVQTPPDAAAATLP